jgi:RNA polymerase sigma-70 factor (ECF subfamily)
MLTARKAWRSESEYAEVPHPQGANALTGSRAGELDHIAQGEKEPIDPLPLHHLIDAAKAGDAEALDQLLASQRPRATAAALRVLHNPDDAEDAVQDAFLKLWRSLPSFEGRSSFSTWVHRIVVNSSVDLMRRCAARPEFVERSPQGVADAAVEPVHRATPESELADREIERWVRVAVTTLPVAHRQVLELREFEDCSYQEMANIIRCPVGTVMSRLHHARTRLAETLRAAA